MLSAALLLLVFVAQSREAASTRLHTAASQLLPPWPPTYHLNLSTIAMPCNYSGYFDPAFGAKFGMVSYDWSDGKHLWAQGRPMDSEALALEQVQRTKAINPHSRTWVYRNPVLAMNWMGDVQKKLDDPQYEGFFLKFSGQGNYSVPACDEHFKPKKCSVFYHDQEQTPKVNGLIGDGNCTAGFCDCGASPCGKYLWNHANGSMLRDFLIHEYVGGPRGIGNKEVDGLYLDDSWSDHADPVPSWAPPTYRQCDMWKTGGPSEEDYHCIVDMGLSRSQVQKIYDEYQVTTAEVQKYIVQQKAYNWQLLRSSADFGRNRSATHDAVGAAKANCAPFLRANCKAGAAILDAPLIYEYTGTENGQGVGPAFPLRSFEEDLAMFLLVRGRFAWIGTSWLGCTQGADPPSPGPRVKGPYTWNPKLDSDVGTPLDAHCRETAADSGIFVRQWSAASVTMDCGSFTGSVTLKRGAGSSGDAGPGPPPRAPV